MTTQTNYHKDNNFANSNKNNLKFSLRQEIDANISFLNLVMHRTAQGFVQAIYRQPTSKYTVIQFFPTNL